MFCTKCGAQIADGSAFCPSCGNAMNAAPQQPVQQPVYQQPVAPQQPVYQQPVQPQYQQPVYQQPVYQQPVYQQPASAGAMDLKQIWHMVIAGVAALALIIGFLTVFGIVDINATLSYGSESRSASGSIWDVEDFTLGVIGNIMMGLCSLVAAAIGLLYFLKQQMNMPYYDQYIAKNLKGMTPAFVMGVIGVIGVVLQVVLFLLEGESEYGLSISYLPHWLTWVGLIAYGALAAVDKFVVNKKAA